MNLAKKILSATLAAAVALTMTACGGAPKGKYTAGTYEASAPGMNGSVSVSVKVDANAIKEVKVTSHTETAVISDPAIADVPAAIVKANSTEVDAVAGATITSDAIKAAVALALAKAEGKDVVDVPVKPTFTDPDVIVIGAGFAGLNAAIEAADGGAKVMLIEKNSAIGGSIRFAGGTLSGAGTEMQIAAGIKDSNENFIADIEKMGGGLNNPELTKKHVENAVAAVNWMDSLGTDFGDRIPTQPQTYDAFGIPREHRVAGGGKTMVEMVQPLLDKHIADGKIVLMLDTEVKDIIIEDGAVTGVIINDTAATQYKAKATILATGGYGHNEEWLHKYNFKNVLTMAPNFVTGDGYNFAQKAGAEFSNMEYLPAYAGGVPVSDTGFVHSVSAKSTKYPGAIWVNTDGKRVLDEFGASDSAKKNIWASTPENIIYMLLSQEMKDAQEPILTVGGKADENWARFDEEAKKGEVVFKADTIEELAKLMGVDEATLKASVEKYNAACAAGKDSEFGRSESLVALKGPFYAIKTVPYVMLTKGGPKMNTEAQVINKDGAPIKGLYQCGELTGGANVGGGASIGGLANTSCIVWGKIAGSGAAAYSLGK